MVFSLRKELVSWLQDRGFVLLRGLESDMLYLEARAYNQSYTMEAEVFDGKTVTLRLQCFATDGLGVETSTRHVLTFRSMRDVFLNRELGVCMNKADQLLPETDGGSDTLSYDSGQASLPDTVAYDQASLPDTVAYDVEQDELLNEDWVSE